MWTYRALKDILAWRVRHVGIGRYAHRPEWVEIGWAAGRYCRACETNTVIVTADGKSHRARLGRVTDA